MANFSIPAGPYILTLRLQGSPQYPRHLWIQSHPSYTGPIKWTSIWFVAGIIPPVGSIVGGNQVNAWAPAADFDAVHRVLQTEKPLFIHISETNQKLDWFWLATSMEPLGEGLQDISP